MKKLFGTDGIRGVASFFFKHKIATKVGEYLGHYYKGQKILIAKDTRLSSDILEHELASAIARCGANVYLLGYASTPALAYLSSHKDYACGIMISASHNPYYDNGIKIFADNGLKINDDLEREIEAYIHSNETIVIDDSELCKIYEDDSIKDYYQFLNNHFNFKLPFKFIVDLANGANFKIAKDVFDLFKFDYSAINDEPSGKNINLNCGSTHLESLKKAVISNKVDFGLAFDGDGDRVLFVDADGEIFDGDKILYLLAKKLKATNQLNKDTIVTTVMSNIGLYKALDALAINYHKVAVGDKYVVKDMLENDLILGGEQSGHIINKQYSNFGDGLLTALMVLEALAYFKISLKEVAKEIKIYPQKLLNIKLADKNKALNDPNFKKLEARIKADLGSDGRVLIRPSGTENLLRLMIEAKNEALIDLYLSELENYLSDNYGPIYRS